MSHRQFVDLAARVPADESELDRGAVVISRAARLRWQREALSPPKEVGVWDHIRSAETVHFFCVVVCFQCRPSRRHDAQARTVLRVVWGGVAALQAIYFAVSLSLEPRRLLKRSRATALRSA